MPEELMWEEIPEQQQSNDPYSDLKGVAAAPVRYLSSIAGFPGDIAEKLRGEVLPKRMTDEELFQDIYQNPSAFSFLKPLLSRLPTSQEISSIFVGKEAAEPRSYDLPLQLASLGIGAGPKALSILSQLRAGEVGGATLAALSKLGQGAVRGAGLYGGSMVGGAFGEAAGEKFGYPKTGETIGSMLGGVGGLKATEAAKNLFGLRPTKVLKSAVKAEESQKTQRTSEILSREEELVKREEKRKSDSVIRYEQEKINQNLTKKELDKKVVDTNTERKNFYNLAEEELSTFTPRQLETNTGNLTQELEQIRDKGGKTAPQSDESHIQKFTQSGIDLIEYGFASLKDLIEYKKDLNAQIYTYRQNKIVHKNLVKARDAVKKVIDEKAKDHPIFGEYWNKAESSNVQYEEAVKARKEFKPKNVQTPKLTPQEQLERIKDTAEKQQLSIEKKRIATPEDKAEASLVKRLLKYGKDIGWSGSIATISKLLGAGNGISGLLGIGGAAVAREFSAFKHILKTYPELRGPWTKSVNAAIKGKPEQLINMLPIMDKLIQQESPEEELVWQEVK